MSSADYNFWSRCLHRLALGANAIADTAFDIENKRFGDAAAEFVAGGVQAPVFVCGLARASTTLHMQLFYETGQFCSLTYQDMPLVMAPNLWQQIRGKKGGVTQGQQERAHGDGMVVSVDSPEAFEEVFWRVNCRRGYLRPERLMAMKANADTVELFRRYVALIQYRYREERGGQAGATRYLSKNNNNILRLRTLAAAYPETSIVVPFRHPLVQARSLLRQHQRFEKLHKKDRFAQQYMTWLVHHEFGGDHRPFSWGHEMARSMNLKPDKPSYWLAQWVGAHRYLLDTVERTGLPVYFSSYERLCENPEQAWASLCAATGVNANLPYKPRELELSDEAEQLGPGNENRLLDEALELHARLSARQSR